VVRESVPEPDLPPETVLEASLSEPPKPRALGWLARAFWSGQTALVGVMVWLWVDRLVSEAFAAWPALGWAVAVVAGVTLAAGLGLLARELLALRRLDAIDSLRHAAAEALASRSDVRAGAAAARLVALMKANPRAARGLAAYERDCHDAVIDGRDRLRLLERHVLAPMDGEAMALISAAARRVSVVTALSPRALFDIAVVLWTAATLVRQLATLYGARPGGLALLRLLRQVVVHVMVTGSMAAGEDLVQQLLGHGLAARLSAKLGEGVLNGLMTARLGLAALALARPLPFIGVDAPDLKDFAGELFSSR
jgi:putative membrane protein